MFKEEIQMKAKTSLFSLVAGGIILAACTGTPAASGSQVTVDRFGNMQPVIQTYTPSQTDGNEVIEYDSKAFLPQYNLDGSITVFTFNNVQVRILPMTDGRTRGALNRTVDEFDALIAQCEGALQTNPQDYDACIMLAGLYIDRGRPGDAELAVKYSSKALEISQNDPQALFVRGAAYAEQGDNPKALSDLERVLKSNLQSLKGVYYIMGMIYYKDGKVDEAIEAFEVVKTIDPDFVDTDEILGILSDLKS
jgi:tetratricopeptide (TPR) repeat protein